jgi:hypothetical protein
MTTPHWIANKPPTNDGSLPVLRMDYKKMPVIAAGIWHAQMAGWERILTYDHVPNPTARKTQRRAKRAQIENDGFQRNELTADEYPFACTKENRGSVFLTNAPIEEQRIQGGELSNFLKQNGALTKKDGYFYFEVHVINYAVHT